MNPKQSRLRASARLAILIGAAALGSPGAAPVRAMSADSSGYAVVLPWLDDTTSFVSTVTVENHSPSTLGLTAYYVGESTSANPGLLVCSEQRLTAAAQTFTLEVPADGVLQFDLRALLEQKCNGSVVGTAALDRGTLTLFARGKSLDRISALARMTRAAGAGPAGYRFSEDGIPLGALEGNTQIVAGLRSGPNVRVDCLVSSLYDATGSGDLYQVTVKDERGNAIGSTTLGLGAWSSELIVDVFSKVGAPGLVVDGARVEIEPVGNKSRPPFVSSCQAVNLANATLDTALSVGRVNEPLDLLRKRRVDTDSTPGWGTFDFVPGGRRPRHAVFLRAPDLVQCGVGDDGLRLTVTAPDGHFVADGCGSVGEFFTGNRGEVNGGEAGAWGIEIDACPSNPRSSAVSYRLVCVSGNGMSQVDRVSP